MELERISRTVLQKEKDTEVNDTEDLGEEK